MNVGWAIIVLCGVTGRLPRDRCNAIELYIVSRVVQPAELVAPTLSSTSNASLVVYVWKIVLISRVLSDMLSTSDLDWIICT